jgi:pimeloyl-ACP methyl ester carboxylesterase
MPYARRDDLSLFYEQEGSADPPLLFIHGWCCDHTFFKPQFDHFKSSHAVTALDLRGCGNSDRPEDGYDLPTLADDVAWLCDELGISRSIVVGHSLGGMIAIELAARHPSGPQAVIAVDPGPINPLPEAQRSTKGSQRSSKGPMAKRSGARGSKLVPRPMTPIESAGSTRPCARCR